MNKRAIILAGGKGTRLKPYTISLPKPLVPIGDLPILEIIILQLKKHGFGHITITVNHMADILMAYFGDGSKWSIKIDYTIETKQLSTMGPLTLVNDLPDHFLVMNGDVLSDLNYAHFYEHHVEAMSPFTIAAHRRIEKIDYGVLVSDEQHQLVGFEEKPNYNFLVSMGVYMVSKKTASTIPADTFYGFDHLMRAMIAQQNYPKIFEFDGFWLDIGRPSDYEKAIEEFEKDKFIG